MEPPTEDARASKRGVIGVAIAWLVLAAISLTLAFTVAEGEARKHATFHLFVGFIAMALFVSIGLLWTPSREGLPTMGRAALLIITAMGAFGQVLESIGASGYDRFNEGHEIEALTTVHNSVGILAPIALFAVPIGLIAVAVLVLGRLLRLARSSRTA